ncbi:MAG: discoidin domain-containing protein [Sedimentisphaerales bacterium]|nr:discoidin domain-containing protein [Sedimentisphaerales bacterium]
MAGPFKVLAHAIWIKADEREPPVTGAAIVAEWVEASSAHPGNDAVNLISPEGLRDRDYDGLNEHSCDTSHMWLSAKGQTEGWVEFDLGAVCKISNVFIWNLNDAWHTDRGVQKADLSVWTEQTGWRKAKEGLSLCEAEGGDDYDDPVIVKLDAIEARKVRLDNLANFGDADHIGLSKVQFFEAHGPKAVQPVPADGTDGVGPSYATLAWMAGMGATAHNVHFGTDPDNLPLLGTVQECKAELSALAGSTKYYWRIDEVQSDGSAVPSKVWSFTTGGLLAWWKLDETEGHTAANAIDSEMDGTLTGDPQWQPSGGKVGGALLFDGDGDYVDCGGDPAFNITDEITVAAWIKVNEFDKGWQSIVTKGDSSWRIARERDANTLQFGTGLYGRDMQAVRGTMDVNDGSWHHVAGVYDGRRLYLYVDGHLDETAFGSGKIPGNDYAVAIGQNTERPDRDWNGLIDDVRLYSCALTKEQIRALAAREEPPLTTAPVALVQHREDPSRHQLMAWWKFDEAEGEVARDSVGDHDGILRGDPTWQPAGGRVGGALEFDGVDDYVETDWVTDLPNWTVAAWIKSPAAPSGPTAQGPIHREQNFQINWDHGDDAFRGGAALCAAGEWCGASFGELAADTWYHLVATYDGENLKAYKDGVLVTDNAAPSGRPNAESTTLTFGKHATADAYFTGMIDDVSIFAYALSADEVKTLHGGKDPVAVAGPVSPPEEAPPAQATVPATALAAQPPAPQAEQPSATVAKQTPAPMSDAATPGSTQAQGTRKTNLVVVFAIVLAVVAIVGVSAFGRKPAT